MVLPPAFLNASRQGFLSDGQHAQALAQIVVSAAQTQERAGDHTRCGAAPIDEADNSRRARAQVGDAGLLVLEPVLERPRMCLPQQPDQRVGFPVDDGLREDARTGGRSSIQRRSSWSGILRACGVVIKIW
jgi:hypothetical protein